MQGKHTHDMVVEVPSDGQVDEFRRGVPEGREQLSASVSTEATLCKRGGRARWVRHHTLRSRSCILRGGTAHLVVHHLLATSIALEQSEELDDVRVLRMHNGT